MLIVDLLLPNVSGTEFLKYIETDPDLRAIPRIVVTAVSKNEVHVVADKIFHKPYDPAELLDAVKLLAPPGAF